MNTLTHVALNDQVHQAVLAPRPHRLRHEGSADRLLHEGSPDPPLAFRQQVSFSLLFPSSSLQSLGLHKYQAFITDL